LNLLEQINVNVGRSPLYVPDSVGSCETDRLPVRLLAFYLPQFHIIPENDLWWGEGFTEWTNVTKAVPRFVGHYQPRLPSALGFYDATRKSVLKRQVDLARRYGIYGFCFHHYWFGGRKLLQRPLETLLANPDIDISFCVNWANESWTRRWDGREKSVLIQQNHSLDDSIAFMRTLLPMFGDRRYITIDGRPLVLIYRPGIIPNIKEIVSHWRELIRAEGFEDPFIAMVQRHLDGDATKYLMDGTVGFPPFYLSTYIAPKRDVVLLDPKFQGVVREYRDLMEASIANNQIEPRTFPGVVPSWDNDARMPARGTCFVNSTPALYGAWLRAACAASMRNFSGDQRLVFINAWNEWAEGAYLEPDRHYGYAYLAETRRVLQSIGPHFNSQLAGGPPRLLTYQDKGISRRIRGAARYALNYMADLAEELAWRLRQ